MPLPLLTYSLNKTLCRVHLEGTPLSIYRACSRDGRVKDIKNLKNQKLLHPSSP